MFRFITVLASTASIAALGGCARLIVDERDRPYIEQIGSSVPGQTQAARQRLVEAHPEWPVNVQQAVIAGEIFEGMERGQVLAAWGMPRRIPYLMEPVDGETWAYERYTPEIHVQIQDSILEYVCCANESGFYNRDIPRGKFGYQLPSSVRREDLGEAPR
jgi:hypothetical protein